MEVKSIAKTFCFLAAIGPPVYGSIAAFGGDHNNDFDDVAEASDIYDPNKEYAEGAYEFDWGSYVDNALERTWDGYVWEFDKFSSAVGWGIDVINDGAYWLNETFGKSESTAEIPVRNNDPASQGNDGYVTVTKAQNGDGDVIFELPTGDPNINKSASPGARGPALG